MPDNDLKRAEILAIMDGIADLQRSLGISLRQPSDREAHDIVARIERRALASQDVSRVTVAAE